MISNGSTNYFKQFNDVTGQVGHRLGWSLDEKVFNENCLRKL